MKTRRLAKLFRNGRSLNLALDHHFFTDQTIGIDQAASMIPALHEAGLDAVLVTKGIAKMYAAELKDVGVYLRVDISTSIFSSSVPKVSPIATIEDALALGAEGIVCMTFPGSEHEYEIHRYTSELAEQADRWNLVLLVESLPYTYAITTPASNSAQKIAAAARIGVELGADVIKTRLTGTEEDRLVIEQAKKPVLVLGGPKTDNKESFFSFIEHSMKVGAKGVAIGRNIWGDQHPLGMIKALNALVHENQSATKALEIYQREVEAN